MAKAPAEIAVVNDYEVVVRGVAAMLAPYDDRVRVVDGSAMRSFASLAAWVGSGNRVGQIETGAGRTTTGPVARSFGGTPGGAPPRTGAT